MPDLTSRLALKKPRGGSSGSAPAEQVDIDVINGNMDALDKAVGALQVASTSLPATPFDGQFVRETDTGDLLVYSSTAAAWRAVSTGTPRTVMTTTQTLATVSNNGTVQNASQPAAFNWNREQKVFVSLTMSASAAGNAAGFIYLQLNGVNLLPTPVRITGLAAAARFPLTVNAFAKLAAGSNTIAFLASTDAGGNTINYNDLVWNLVTA